MPGKERIPILSVRKEWECPKCGATDVTNEARPHTRMHACPALGGITVPFVDKAREAVSGRARVSERLREDYVGKEKGLTYNEAGKPVMAVVTEYADGSNDAAVYPAVANIDVRKGL